MKYWKIVALLALIAIFFYFILPISVPLILAFATAALLNPVVLWLVDKSKGKMGRGLSVSIVFILSMLLIATASFFIITKSATQVINFTENVPEYLSVTNQKYEAWESDFKKYSDNIPKEIITQVTDSINGMVDTAFAWVNEKITVENLASLFGKVPDMIVAMIVYLMALYLFMLELPKLSKAFYGILTEKTEKKIRLLNEKTVEAIIGYALAHFKCSLIILGATFVGLLIIKPETAIIMSLVIWVVDLIPIVGSIVVLAPWAAIAFSSGDTTLGISLSILAVILLIIRRVVEPKIMGDQIGISPLAALISMFIGYKIIGFLGFIIGPLAVMLYAAFKEAGIINFKIKI